MLLHIVIVAIILYYGKNVQQNEYGNLYAEHGLWNTTDDYLLAEGTEPLEWVIVVMMYDYAREAAGIEFRI